MTINIRRILVPIDFSEHAEYVIEWASHLALEHSSQLSLLHVYHLPVEFQQLEGAWQGAALSGDQHRNRRDAEDPRAEHQ